jgi:alpha-glucosidase
MLMLALPGSAYIYQGEELGLPEVIDLPAEARQDPTFHSTGGEILGRDGCRVPLPWEKDAPGYGFGTGESTWLPQPDSFGPLAVDLPAPSC